MRLPCRGSNIWYSIGIFKYGLCLLESLACSLREKEVDVEESDKVEYRKDDVGLDKVNTSGTCG
jgi:hypothetical protein